MRWKEVVDFVHNDTKGTICKSALSKNILGGV